MSKAECRAIEKYPIEMYEEVGWRCVDKNSDKRKYFIEGYHQAEKDLELTWEDMAFIRLAFDAIEANIYLGAIKISPMTKEYYQEVLKRFLKERKDEYGRNLEKNRRL